MSNDLNDAPIRRDLSIEAKELQSAVYVLNEELIPTLVEGNLNLVSEVGPTFSEDIFKRRLKVSDNPDFPSDVSITQENGSSLPVCEAYCLYRKVVFEEPLTHKHIRVSYKKVNPAYLFPDEDPSIGQSKKTLEMTRYEEMNNKDFEFSAFDSEDGILIPSESIMLSFDGYNFEFRKMLNKEGKISISLEISQYDKVNKRNKILRRSNTLPQLKEKNFDDLKYTILEALKKSRR